MSAEEPDSGEFSLHSEGNLDEELETDSDTEVDLNSSSGSSDDENVVDDPDAVDASAVTVHVDGMADDDEEGRTTPKAGRSRRVSWQSHSRVRHFDSENGSMDPSEEEEEAPLTVGQRGIPRALKRKQAGGAALLSLDSWDEEMGFILEPAISKVKQCWLSFGKFMDSLVKNNAKSRVYAMLAGILLVFFLIYMAIIPSSGGSGSSWQPTSLPLCMLWLDSADGNAFLIGEEDESFERQKEQRLQQWQDLSGHENHAVQGSELSRPYVGGTDHLLGVRFVSRENTYMSIPNIAQHGNFPRSIFVVAELEQIDGNKRSAVLSTGQPRNESAFGLVVYDHGRVGVEGYSPRCDVFPERGRIVIDRRRHMMGVVLDPETSGSLRLYADGWNAESVLQRHFNTDGQVNYLGRTNNMSGNFLNGIVYEVIVYNRALSEAEVQAVWLYLKGKWNLSEDGEGPNEVLMGEFQDV